MSPEQLAKSGTEHAEQMAFFCWCNMAANFGFFVADDMKSYSNLKFFLDNLPMHQQQPIPQLKWIHAIPNAGARGNKVAAGQLKAEGVKAGIADIFLPVPKPYTHSTGSYHGLYIELKRSNGVPSDVTNKQEEFGAFVISQGYEWIACFGWRAAALAVKQYLSHA